MPGHRRGQKPCYSNCFLVRDSNLKSPNKNPGLYCRITLTCLATPLNGCGIQVLDLCQENALECEVIVPRKVFGPKGGKQL